MCPAGTSSDAPEEGHTPARGEDRPEGHKRKQESDARRRDSSDSDGDSVGPNVLLRSVSNVASNKDSITRAYLQLTGKALA